MSKLINQGCVAPLHINKHVSRRTDQTPAVIRSNFTFNKLTKAIRTGVTQTSHLCSNAHPPKDMRCLKLIFKTTTLVKYIVIKVGKPKRFSH